MIQANTITKNRYHTKTLSNWKILKDVGETAKIKETQESLLAQWLTLEDLARQSTVSIKLRKNV